MQGIRRHTKANIEKYSVWLQKGIKLNTNQNEGHYCWEENGKAEFESELYHAHKYVNIANIVKLALEETEGEFWLPGLEEIVELCGEEEADEKLQHAKCFE